MRSHAEHGNTMKTLPAMTPASDSPTSPALTRQPRRNALRKGLTVVSLCVAIIYICSVVFNRLWLFELMTHYRVQLATVMVPLAIALLATRRSIWGWSFSAFAASAVVSCIALGVPVSQPAAGKTLLRIMSANVYTANSRYTDFLNLVGEVNPDILAIVEYTKHWDKELTSLHNEYLHRVTLPRKHGFGIALFSKQPLRNVEAVWLLKYFDGPTIFCDVDVDGSPLSVIALHTISPLSIQRFTARNTQFEALARRIKDDQRPRVVLGDFNATTWSPYLTDLLRAGELRDSRQGIGLLPTWPQFFWPMLISIDHAFVSQEICVHRRWVERDIGSDHFPIVVDISISPR